MPRLSRSTYAEQLARSCAQLAIGQMDGLPAEIVAGSAGDIDRYLQVGWGERRMLLTQELALVALAFDDFSSLVDLYLRTVAKVVQVPQSTDQRHFLQWLKRTRELTPQQREFIAYQQAEYSCVMRARSQRAAHLAFQQLRCRPVPVAGAAEAAIWHVNPVRAWSRLAMPGPDGRELRPCDVVFYPVGERVENVRASRRQRRWLSKLPSTWAGTFAAWMTKTGCRRPKQLQASLESWTAAGLVTVETIGAAASPENRTKSV